MIHLTCQACYSDWALTEAEVQELRDLMGVGAEEEAEVVACPQCYDGAATVYGHA